LSAMLMMPAYLVFKTDEASSIPFGLGE